MAEVRYCIVMYATCKSKNKLITFGNNDGRKCLGLGDAVESASLIRFPLLVAMTEHTKLCIGMHVTLHNSLRQNCD